MRLQDIINAGGYCVYAGVQKRPLVKLSKYTQQGGGGPVTPGDVVTRVTRRTREGSVSGGLAVGGAGGRLRFGKGE